MHTYHIRTAHILYFSLVHFNWWQLIMTTVQIEMHDDGMLVVWDIHLNGKKFLSISSEFWIPIVTISGINTKKSTARVTSGHPFWIQWKYDCVFEANNRWRHSIEHFNRFLEKIWGFFSFLKVLSCKLQQIIMRKFNHYHGKFQLIWEIKNSIPKNKSFEMRITIAQTWNKAQSPSGFYIANLLEGRFKHTIFRTTSNNKP